MLRLGDEIRKSMFARKYIDSCPGGVPRMIVYFVCYFIASTQTDDNLNLQQDNYRMQFHRVAVCVIVMR